MSNDGRAVANYVLDLCEREGYVVTNLSLQKIVYFCHVWSLVLLGKPLVRHSFEAWQHGPVLGYLYREFRKFGSSKISSRATGLDKNTGELSIVEYEFDAVTEKLLGSVVRLYAQIDAGSLVDISHEVGGPWERAWNHNGSVHLGMKIKNEDILDFYSAYQHHAKFHEGNFDNKTTSFLSSSRR